MTRRGSVTTSEDFNQSRPDVIMEILKEDWVGHPHLLCGFDLSISLGEGPVDIGFEINGLEFFVSRLAVVSDLIVGKHGWLFLDKDKNRSVDQYRGKFLISENQLGNWDKYFQSLEDAGKRMGFKSALIMTPAKEHVFSDYYPLKRAQLTPVEQIMSAHSGRIIYPIDELIVERAVAFSKGDTHWTDYGAFLGALRVCEALNIKHGLLFIISINNIKIKNKFAD